MTQRASILPAHRRRRLIAALLVVPIVLLALLAAYVHRRAPPPGPPAADIRVGPAGWVDPSFGRIMLYRPAGAPRGLVLFLSGDGGWRGTVDGMARTLAEHGLLVAGLSTGRLLRHVEQETRGCAQPNFPLLGLAADIEHRTGFARYARPVLIGYSAGATLAYGAIAQAPAGSYAGAVSIAFSPDIVGTKPWCPGRALTATRVAEPAPYDRPGWLFAARRPPLPWTMIQGRADGVVDFATARAFAAAAQGRFVALPGVDHGFGDPLVWRRPLLRAVLPLLGPVAPPAGVALPADLPLDTVVDPAAPPTDLMAVFYSGDGGWAGLDRQVAAGLAQAGIPVVGVDSLAYFWTARTPAGAGADLARILSGYSRLWHRPRVLLVGYSFGADALPAITRTLPPQFRARIARVGLIGLGTGADFQFHLGSWLDVPTAAARPTVPDVVALGGLDMVCIRGTEETDSACPLVPPGIVHDTVIDGGHHLGDHVDRIIHSLLSDVRN